MKTSTMPIAVPIQFSGQVTSMKARQRPGAIDLGGLEQREVEVDQRQVDRRHHEGDEQIDMADGGGGLACTSAPSSAAGRASPSAMLIRPTGPEHALQRGDAQDHAGEERRGQQEHEQQPVAAAMAGDEIGDRPGDRRGR